MTSSARPNLKKKTFSVDARAILQFGRESIRDHTTAILELVKNSYDADATTVEVEIYQHAPEPFVRIADNGIGMTEKDIDDKWLRIGFSEKLSDTVSKRRRRQTGEKGVGRISADRLGSQLRLGSRAKNAVAVQLTVDWDKFDVGDRELATIPLSFSEGADPKVPTRGAKQSTTGTELVVTKLRQNWSESDVRALQDELSYLTPPFGRVEDFEIILANDVAPSLDGVISSPFYDVAEIELAAQLTGNTIQYEIRDRIGRKATKRSDRGTLDWPQLMGAAFARSVVQRENSLAGPVELKLLFYPRKADTLLGTEFRLSDLREFLDRNAGVKIYRDNVRVRPYGDSYSAEGDWLGLAERKSRDPAGISRRSFRAAANQVVGAVFISRDANPSLVDSAGREGLINNEALADLRRFVLGCLAILETHRYESYQKRPKKTPVANPLSTVRDAKDELATLKSDLQIVRRGVPQRMARSVERALDSVAVIDERIRATEDAMRDALTESGVLRGLATLGIAASVFGHETQSAISSLLGSTKLCQELLRTNEIDLEIFRRELDKANKYARQVGAWGSFALARVRKDKRERRKVSLDRTVWALRNDLDEAFKSASIDFQVTAEHVTARTFEMDIEAVLLNLITNAYLACLQVKRSRIVRVSLKALSRDEKKGFSIAVGDSGPGIPDSLRDKIWRPLFTTRTDERGRQTGTGLGLAIVRSILDDLGGSVDVTREPTLRGALFTLWFPAN
ncbi:MAG: ATP-binding protein [Gemmatimonadaceae bacterium]